MRSYLKSTLNPLLGSLHNRNDNSESSILKRVADLDMALVHYEQNLDIPEVHLVYTPLLTEAADRCRAAGRLLTSTELGWGEKPSSDLLNGFLSIKGQWAHEIHKLISHTRELNQGTTIQEINYWSVLRSSLETISHELESYEVQLLFSILKDNNLVVSAGTFEATTGLRSRLEEAVSNEEWLSGLPMNSLLACNDFSQMEIVIEKIFTQLKRVKNVKGYPVSRTVDLVNSINKDVLKQCITILNASHAMQEDYDVFSTLIGGCLSVLKQWDNQTIPFWSFLRSNSKMGPKTGNKPVNSISIRFIDLLIPLKERLEMIQAFRSNHERFLVILQQMCKTVEDKALVNLVQSAYEPFRRVVISDLSESAASECVYLTKEYNRVVDQVDQSIVETIRTQLSGVSSTEQMFTIFRRFTKLFFRPHIQGLFLSFE